MIEIKELDTTLVDIVYPCVLYSNCPGCGGPIMYTQRKNESTSCTPEYICVPVCINPKSTGCLV